MANCLILVKNNLVFMQQQKSLSKSRKSMKQKCRLVNFVELCNHLTLAKQFAAKNVLKVQYINRKQRDEMLTKENTGARTEVWCDKRVRSRRLCFLFCS